jgi:hypothetical protein
MAFSPEALMNVSLSACKAARGDELVLNRNYAERWPNITAKKDTPKNAGAYRKEMGKFDKLTSPCKPRIVWCLRSRTR